MATTNDGDGQIAIVSVSSGYVLGSDAATMLDLPEDHLLAALAGFVAQSDPAETRRFALWRLKMWEGMTEAEYWTLPRSIAELEASGAVLDRIVAVPMNRHSMDRWGDDAAATDYARHAWDRAMTRGAEMERKFADKEKPAK